MRPLYEDRIAPKASMSSHYLSLSRLLTDVNVEMWSWYYSRWKAFIAIITRTYQETKLSLLMVPLRVSHCHM